MHSTTGAAQTYEQAQAYENEPQNGGIQSSYQQSHLDVRVGDCTGIC